MLILFSEYSKVTSKQFNFNAPFDLKFKRFKNTKNLKKLIHRLRLSNSLCEQKIEYRKRFYASLVPNPNDKINFTNITFQAKTDLAHLDEIIAKDVDFEDKILNNPQKQMKSTANQKPKLSSPNSANQKNSVILVDVSPTEQPKQKKIFKFIKIMANEFSRDYFKTFLKKSLFQNDPTHEKRTPLTKFRKDVLLIDCSVYMLEFWEQLQKIFEKFNLALMEDGNDPFKFYHTFCESFHILLAIIGDQRFFYTFSKQFLSVSNKLMGVLERFLLGDIELDSLNICHPYYGLDLNFDYNNELFKIESFQQCTIDENIFNSVLKKIDWEKYLDIFYNLERILFNCFNEEFYPQFLISNEYDQLLDEYFQQSPSEQELLMNLEVLPSEKWHHLNQQSNLKQNLHFNTIVKLSNFLEIKPVNKIHLLATQTGNKTENDTKLIDLYKNRNMLLNSLEFPFVYLGYVKFILLIRLKLKLLIMVLVQQYELSLNEKLETNQLNLDLMRLLDQDIRNLLKSISQIHRILLRTFCWLQADFSCNITNVNLNECSGQTKLSSKLNTGETKLFSLIENLFKNSDSHSKNTSNENKNSTFTSVNNKFSSNLEFQINVSTLLFRFNYNNLKRSIPLSAIIGFNNPNTIIAEANSIWQHNWTKQISFNQFQQFYQQIIKPFIRINIFLESFSIRNYLTAIMNLLNENENFFPSNVIVNDEQNITDSIEQTMNDLNQIDSISNITDSEISVLNFSDTNLVNVADNNKPLIMQESKILVQFLRNTNQLLKDVKRKKWSLHMEMKKMPTIQDSGCSLDGKKIFQSNFNRNKNNNNIISNDDGQSEVNPENSNKRFAFGEYFFLNLLNYLFLVIQCHLKNYLNMMNLIKIQKFSMHLTIFPQLNFWLQTQNWNQICWLIKMLNSHNPILFLKLTINHKRLNSWKTY